MEASPKKFIIILNIYLSSVVVVGVTAYSVATGYFSND